MIHLEKAFVGIGNTKGLFELLKNGGVLFIGKYAVKIEKTPKWYQIDLYIHGKDYTDKVLIDMATMKEIEQYKKQKQAIRQEKKADIKTSNSSKEEVELF